LHCAVAFAGESLGRVLAAAPDVPFADFGAGVVDLGSAEAGFASGFVSLSHSATPPCFEHAPVFVFAVLYVPSLH
jgi:hypothetical protein